MSVSPFLLRNRETVFLPGGILGQVLSESLAGRVRRMGPGTDNNPFALFEESAKEAEFDGNWQGEHAGKWLISAARAAVRTGDEELAEQVKKAAASLCQTQEPDGYLGTYAPANKARFTTFQAEGIRTWDIWVHAYAILGLLEVHCHWPDERLIETCRRVARLLKRVFDDEGRMIARYGNHQGLSSFIAIHPLAELALATGDSLPLDLAKSLLAQAEADPSLRPISKLLDGQDVSTVGTGKAYQLCWLLLGLARLAAATGDDQLLQAAKSGWESVHTHHLTLGGGPWGGIGRHKEVFNDPGAFDRYGLVETCSSMAWMQLSRELLRQERDPRYAEAIETTLWNSVLGAFLPGGEEWCYFIFPNGRRNPTYAKACCKSSGMIALEEAPLAFCEVDERGIWLHLITAGTAHLPSGAELEITSDMPFQGSATVKVRSESPRPVFLRIPKWAEGATVGQDGQIHHPTPGTYFRIDASSAEIEVELPMSPKPVWATETLDHHGQEIVRREYLAMVRGPLVYAAGPLDGFQTEAVLDLRNGFSFEPALSPSGAIGPAFHLNRVGHEPVLFQPFFEAGGWSPRTYRMTYFGAVRP